MAALCLAGVHGAHAQTALPEVAVQAPAEMPGDAPRPLPGGNVSSRVQLGALGDSKVLDSPFSVISYTAKTLEDTQARSVADLLSQVDPAVREEYGDGTSSDGLVIRGFPVSNNDISLNGLPGILGQFRVLPNFVERTEVLNGPSAALFGMTPSGSVGGMVNLISKRATDVPITALTTGFTSRALWNANADIARRFGTDNVWGIRVNAGLLQGDSAREHFSERSRTASVGLDFTDTRLRASIDVIHQSQYMRGVAGSLNFSALEGPPPAAMHGQRNVAPAWNWQDSRDDTLMAQVEYDVSERITVFGAAGQSRNASSALLGATPYLMADGSYAFQSVPVYWRQYTLAAQAGVKGWFDTGAVRHHWSFSASQLRRRGHAQFFVAALDGGGGVGHIGQQPDLPAPTPAPMDPLGSLDWRTRMSLPGYALMDTLSMAQDRVRLTLGLRRQLVRSDNQVGFPVLGMDEARYDHGVTSPVLALLVKPAEHVSLYANHVQGVSQGDTAPYGTTNRGEAFTPYRTRQWEAGVKLAMGDVVGTLGVFQITRPAGFIDPETNTFVVNSAQRHRGVELNVMGALNRHVRLLGGATVMQARMVGARGTPWDGKRTVGAARRQFTLTGEWDLPAMQGLTLVTRAVHTGSVYADPANLTRVPGWTVVDLGLRYATEWVGTPVTLRATVENAFDKRYWKQGQLAATLGMPRRVALSSTFAF